MSSHKEIFTDIYERDVWGGSGGGSILEVTTRYRILLKRFINQNKINSVVDFGCGDWSFSRHIDWKCNYLGIDCVESVINKNKSLFEKDNIRFEVGQAIESGADLLILKDVLQHWTNEDVVNFLDQCINKFRFIIVTNTSNQTKDWQDSLMPSKYPRPLSSSLYPLKKYSPKILLSTNINEPKETSLIHGVD